MVARHNRHAQVVTAFVHIPAELEDGKVRCNACAAVVGVTPNGRTRDHKTPAGEPCAYRVTYKQPVDLAEVPEVVIPVAPKRWDWTGRVGRNPDSRLDNGSECEDCGRWLPGERRLCGRCSNHRAAKRKGGG